MKARERAQGHGLIKMFLIRTKKRRVRTGDRIEHVLAPPGVAHGDSPSVHAAFGQRVGTVGIDDPGDRRGIQIAGCDRQYACCQGGGDLGIGEGGRLTYECRGGLAAAKERHAPGTHAATG